MTQHCTEERFLDDIKNHQLTVIRNDQTNRHLKFKKPGTICYGFDIITWPGHLCITGDMGTYVFQRVHDMFEFFRTDKPYADAHPEKSLFINAGYWGEKLLSIDKHGGYREFDEEDFAERVTQHFNEWKESASPTTEQTKELWQEITDEVLSAIDRSGEAACLSVDNFYHEEFSFTDFFDGGRPECHTFHYLWCLYAIAWAIIQYDTKP